jgi:hypothetical protein
MDNACRRDVCEASKALLNSDRRRTTHSEYLRSRDVARILPLSVRQIEAMAAEGTLPAFKLSGCSVWLFDEVAIRRKISEQIAETSQRQVLQCRTQRAKVPTTTSTSAAINGTSDMNSAGSNTASRLTRLMSARHGKRGTVF